MTENSSGCIRIFLSSTFLDLEAERREIVNALRCFPLVQVINMEDFGARPQGPNAKCLDWVSASHVYVGVLGERYGSEDDFGVSITRQEYHAANDKPCYIYNLTDPPDPKEKGKKRKVVDFKNEVRQHHTIKMTSRKELTRSIVTDLTEEFIIGQDAPDAFQALVVMALLDAPFTRNMFESLLEWIYLPNEHEVERPQRVYSTVKQLRIQNAWNYLSRLHLLVRISDIRVDDLEIVDPRFDIDAALRKRVRESVLNQRSDPGLLRGFVDYFLDQLIWWNDPKSTAAGIKQHDNDETIRQEREQDIEDWLNYQMAFQVAQLSPNRDDEYGAEHPITKLAKGLIGIDCDGFLQKGQDAREFAQAAAKFLRRTKRLSEAELFTEWINEQEPLQGGNEWQISL